MILEEEDKGFIQEKEGAYRIKKISEQYLLKKIRIKKKPLQYSFIGGMWYSTSTFSFDQFISLPFPFTTYYTYKILDKVYNETICRSLLYAKTPLMIIQFEDECIGITFDPKIVFKDTEIFPFISLEEDDEFYTISFYLFTSYEYKEKNQAWLGLGKKQTATYTLQINDRFDFSVKIVQAKNWEELVKKSISTHLPDKLSITNTDELFDHAKHALYRSYDHLTGTFLQLPWRKTPGFTFSNSSYSLTSYDAVRLHYFSEWYELTKDVDFLLWQKDLRELFLNPGLFVKPRSGEGIIWYNMTNLTRKGLEGFFYLDCGYAGYPGGQATIAYHLLKYLTFKDDAEIESLVKKSLQYLLSTQHEDGSWPMAIKQKGLMSVRREKLQDYITSGGTGECVRALLEGYKRFKQKQYKDAAFHALAFLDTKYPLCVNGLRDIGIQEPEAFSAISIIDAYLDAYELTKEKHYLNEAITYASYSASWIYLYNIAQMEFIWNFHPISYSITPRLSPFEATRIVTTFKRLAQYSNDPFWNMLADLSFNEVKKWVTKNGGLSEGVFPIKNQLKRLPMEQTFATVELMKSCLNYSHPKKQRSPKTNKENIKDITFKKDKNMLSIRYKGEKIFSFNVEKWKIDYVKHARLNDYGITCSFFKPYSLKSHFKRILKKYLRGSLGKYILGISDVKYVLKGVYGPKPLKEKNISSFEKIKKTSFSIEIKGKSAHCHCETSLHHLSTTVSAYKQGKDLCIQFTPLTIEVLDHDIDCQQVLFPIIGSKPSKIKKDMILFEGFSVKGAFPKIYADDTVTAVDQTLSTNWTHGGIYQKPFEVIIKNIEKEKKD